MQRRMDGDDLFMPKGKPPPQPQRPDLVRVELTGEIAEQIKRSAARYHMSISEFMRQALQFALDRMEA